MNALEARLDAILKDPLRMAAAGGALGYVGLDIPPDLLLAHPQGSCHLPWRIAQPTPLADEWLESSFPIWARSILEDWAAGRFDGFAQVLFTRGEDISQRLYYYVCELQRRGKIAGPEALILDIARIQRASSRQYSIRSLRHLAGQLQLTDEALKRGIHKANASRALFGKLRATRCARGSVYEKWARASLFADVASLTDVSGSDPAASSVGRLILAGSSPPDDRLHRCVESCGWAVVDEFYDRNLERLGAAVDPQGDDLMAGVMKSWLAHTFLARNLNNPDARLLAEVQQAKADAVILWFARDDEALAWQVPRLRRALDEAGTPHVSLSARAWNFEDGSAAEIRSFLGGLRP